MYIDIVTLTMLVRLSYRTEGGKTMQVDGKPGRRKNGKRCSARSSCRCAICTVLMIIASAFTSGCGNGMQSQDTKKNVASQRIDVLPTCHNAEELAEYYATESLGGTAEVQERGRFLFVQTFPYSGVRASHLYVYRKESDAFRFECFVRLRTQDKVGLSMNDNGTVEIHAGDERVAVLDQPSDT